MEHRTRDEIIKRLVSEFRFSVEQAENALRARFRCEYCDRDLLSSVDAYHSWHLDHLVPRSRGGADAVENYALSCKPCNFMKRHWD